MGDKTKMQNMIADAGDARDAEVISESESKMIRYAACAIAVVLLWGPFSSCEKGQGRPVAADAQQQDTVLQGLPNLSFEYEPSLYPEEYLLISSRYDTNRRGYVVTIRLRSDWKRAEVRLPEPDTTFIIAPAEHQRIYEHVTSIAMEDMVHAEQRGLDGASWIIECGRAGAVVRMSAWSPNLNMEERHLESFVEAGEAFFDLARRGRWGS